MSKTSPIIVSNISQILSELDDPILEINSSHPMIMNIAKNIKNLDHKKISSLLIDQANILDGNSLQNPARYIENLTDLFIKK